MCFYLKTAQPGNRFQEIWMKSLGCFYLPNYLTNTPITANLNLANPALTFGFLFNFWLKVSTG